MKKWKLKLQLIIEEFFQFSLLTYVLLLLAETVKEGIVSSFFNLTILLVVVVASGVITILLHNEKVTVTSAAKKITKLDKTYTLLLAVGSSILIYYQTQSLGDIALLIAFIAGIIVILISSLLLRDTLTS